MTSYKPIKLFDPSFSTPEIALAINTFSLNWGSIHDIQEEIVLYHYTTLEGLNGIINNRNLWLSHINTFNDPLEIKYGQEIISHEITEKIKDHADQEIRTFLNSLLVHIKAFGDELIHHPFVACFCEIDELLSQWRTYSDSGGGYSLGFKFSPNTKISSKLPEIEEHRSAILRKVIYEEKKQRKLINEYLSTIIKAANSIIKKDTNKDLKIHVMALESINIILDMLMTFKNPAFKEEREWRLIHVTREDFQPDNVEFRVAGNNFIPYRPTFLYSFEGDKPIFPLESITIGPLLGNQGSITAIKLFLQKASNDNHQIKLNPSIKISSTGYSIR